MGGGRGREQGGQAELGEGEVRGSRGGMKRRILGFRIPPEHRYTIIAHQTAPNVALSSQQLQLSNVLQRHQHNSKNLNATANNCCV